MPKNLPRVHWRLVDSDIVWVKVGVEGRSAVRTESGSLRLARGCHVAVVRLCGSYRGLVTSHHLGLHIVLQTSYLDIIINQQPG